MQETPTPRPQVITPKHLALLILSFDQELRAPNTLSVELRAQLVRDFASAVLQQNRIVTNVSLSELAEEVARLIKDLGSI